MELNKNQFVIFNGKAKGYLEVRWSEKEKSFFILDENDEKIYSNEVIEKPARKRNTTKQTDISKMKEISPLFETEKAYAVEDGSNGKIGRGQKAYYKYYPKSLCIVENEKVYVPIWI